MLRLFHLLRRSPLEHHMQLIRGPKKKKGETEAKIESEDIINIFKDRPDPELKEIQQYPVFVQEMAMGQNSVHEYSCGTAWLLRDKMPTRGTWTTYLRGFKKQRCKAIGKYKHIDRHAKSFDDESKDIMHRLGIYDVLAKSAEELEEEERIKQEQFEKQQEEDDQ